MWEILNFGTELIINSQSILLWTSFTELFSSINDSSDDYDLMGLMDIEKVLTQAGHLRLT